MDLLHCYLKVSRLLPTEDCDRMRVERLCVYGRVCLVEIEYICFEYKAIISSVCTLFRLI